MWILFLILIFIVAILAWCFTNSIKDYGIKQGLILPLLYASLFLGGLAFIIWLLIKCDFNANDKINNTKVRIKSDKQKNVAKLLADRRFRKMA